MTYSNVPDKTNQIVLLFIYDLLSTVDTKSGICFNLVTWESRVGVYGVNVRFLHDLLQYGDIKEMNKKQYYPGWVNLWLGMVHEFNMN